MIQNLLDNLQWKERNLKRNEFLKTSGTIDTNVYFVEEGSVRLFIEDEGVCYHKDGKKALDIDIHCNKPLTGLDFYFHYIYFYDTTSLNDLQLNSVKSFNDYSLI
jgi:hypothetical protein